MRHEAGLPWPDSNIVLETLKRENIKKNVIGDWLAKMPQMWVTKTKRADPENVVERAYHAVTKDMITNEVFRRVEPSGRTMGEYLEQEFAEVDVHTRVLKSNKAVYDRIADLTHDTDASGYFESLMARLPASEIRDQTNMGKNAAASFGYDHEKMFMPDAMELIGRRSQTTFVTSD
jgi:hypothetical protein